MFKVRLSGRTVFNSIVVLVLVLTAFLVGFTTSNFSNREYFEAHNVENFDHTRTAAERFQATRIQPELQSLFETAQFGSFIARTNMIYDVIERVDINEFEQYLEHANSLDPPDFREEVQNVIIERWSALDPKSAFNKIRESFSSEQEKNLLPFVFREWVHLDIDEAIKHGQLLSGDSLESAVASMVISREDLSIEQLRKLARQFDCEWIAIKILSESTDNLIIESPEQEWIKFFAQHKNNLLDLTEANFKLLAEISYSWVVQEGVEAYRRIVTSFPNDSKLLDLTRTVALRLVNTEPQLAFNLTLDLIDVEHDPAYRALVLEVIGYWTENDPNTALLATFAVSARSLRRKMQSQALARWSEIDHLSLLKFLDSLPIHEQGQIRDLALTEIAKIAPETVSNKLHLVLEREKRSTIAKAIVESWTSKDIVSTLQWIDRESSVAHIRDALRDVAFGKLARTNPQLALQTAFTQGVDGNGIGWEAKVLERLAIEDMDMAVSMLPHARPGPTRLRAYDGIIFFLLIERDFERAMDLFLHVSDVESSGTLMLSLIPLIHSVPNQLFESLDILSSDSIRSDIARRLFDSYKDTDRFTEKQLTYLQTTGQRGEPKHSP